jgi:fibronectin-binding autotransporter adhesin
MKKSFLNKLFSLAFVASASMAMAAFTPITNITTVFVPGVDPVRDEINLVSLTTLGNTFSAATTALGNGTTTLTNGAAQANLSRMDNLNLNDLATGMPVQWRTVMFGGVYFTNQNGPLPDFFLFEAAGGANPEDNGAVAAVFEGDSTSDADDFIGVSVLIGNNTANNSLATGWGDTGSNITANAFAQSGQDIVGIAWDITDLKDTNGVNLLSTTPIKGIAMTAAFANLDPCAILAVVPPSGIDHFNVTTTAGSPQLVGVPFDVTITAQDPSNVTVDNSFSTVKIAAAGTLMEFDWNSDGTYGDNSGKLVSGVKTIKARNKRAETTASGLVATVGLATTVSPPSVTTIADVFSQLQVLVPGEFGAPGTATGKGGNPAIQGLGGPFNVTVNAVDLYWNFLAGAPADTISIVGTNELGVNTALPVSDAPLAGGTVIFSVTITNSGPTNYIVAANVTDPAITNGLSAIVNASQSLVWQGDGAANNWDVLTTANWTNLLGAVITYNNGNFVSFDDTGSATPAVNIVGTVTPLSVNLNSANNYSFISTNNGGIAGTTAFNKVGAGNLRLATSNSYTGGTSFTDGVLTVAHSNAVPNSGAFIFTNATLLLEADLVRTAGSTRIVGSPAGFGGSFTIAAVGGNRALTLNQLTWGNTGNNLFPGELSAQLILGRAMDNTTLQINSRITLSVAGLGGTRRFVVADGSQDVDVLITAQIDDASATPGNLYKLGAGTLHLSSTANNWDGETVIEDGRLIITGGWANPARTITLGDGGSANATLQLGNASGAVNANVGVLSTSPSDQFDPYL